MMQKFFTESIQSDFIKSLIHNTPIPIIDTVNDNSYLLEGNVYIHKGDIIKCVSSGIVRMPKVDDGYTAWYRGGDIKIIKNEGGVNYTGDKIPNGYIPINQAVYNIIGDYRFGMYYPMFTQMYNSNYDYYDSTTHEHLGRLLRCYRDIYELNLMPFYNCVSGNYVSNILIKNDRIVGDVNTSAFKTFKIPVKFNTTYTIAMDCSSNVKIAPALLSNNSIIDNVRLFGANNIVSEYKPQTLLLENANSNIFIFNTMTFKRPQTVSFSLTDLGISDSNNRISKYEKYLYMLIQIPITNKSSVAVLEGDYTKVGIDNVYNVEGIHRLNNLELSNLMTSDLSLLSMNDGEIHPYSNRLIEYLLENVITHRDTITNDIDRVQESLHMYDYPTDIWDNIVRNNIYQKYKISDSIQQIDLNGFVDRDVEEMLKKLKV